MAMTDEQIERYSRHIILKEVGAKGQKKLLKGKVLIIGAGPTGICTLLCVMLKNTKHIIMYEKNKNVSNLLISIIRMYLLFLRKNVRNL